ncbi:hypothetical protein GCM10009784_23570 [Arthrobacter parietis]|uniref:Secreted protein n=1 Tax=Arthrobacter parietis TaxID=271434 RepID=A0ABP5MPN1_9MICC
MPLMVSPARTTYVVALLCMGTIRGTCVATRAAGIMAPVALAAAGMVFNGWYALWPAAGAAAAGAASASDERTTAGIAAEDTAIPIPRFRKGVVQAAGTFSGDDGRWAVMVCPHL